MLEKYTTEELIEELIKRDFVSAKKIESFETLDQMVLGPATVITFRKPEEE